MSINVPHIFFPTKSSEFTAPQPIYDKTMVLHKGFTSQSEKTKQSKILPCQHYVAVHGSPDFSFFTSTVALKFHLSFYGKQEYDHLRDTEMRTHIAW